MFSVRDSTTPEAATESANGAWAGRSKGAAGPVTEYDVAVDQFLAECDAGWIVHRKELDRRSSHGCFSKKHRSIPPEMFRPKLFSWIEKTRKFFRHWIDSSEIGPFMKVTAQARVREVA